MSETRSYPHGVPSWVDTTQPDPEAAQHFYRELLGWTFATVTPPGAPFHAIASLGGRDVAGMEAADAPSAGWNTYVAVDDADATVARAAATGGEIVAGPLDPGPAGRLAICRDPAGAEFRLCERPHWHVTFAVADRDAAAVAAERLGAEVLSQADTRWTRTAVIRDSQGAAFSASQFTPPASAGGK
jgi:predicted enzyme related to lactoylglutathione lyase